MTPAPSNVQPASRSGSPALRGGVACLIIACVIALVPFPTFFLWTVFVFVAFILAIVAMAQGRVGGGVVLLLLCLFIPGPCALAGMAMFAKSVSSSESSSRSSQYSPTYAPSTATERRESATAQPTVKPIEPSRRPAEALVAPSAAPTPALAEVEAEPKTVAVPPPVVSVAPQQPAQRVLVVQQTEAWPPIDTVAVGQAVLAKVGTSPGVTVIPALEPRIRLRHALTGNFTWANATLDRFLFVKTTTDHFVSLGEKEPMMSEEKPSTGKMLGVTATHDVRWKGTDTQVSQWPKHPLFVLTSLADGTSVTVPYPALPDDILSDNATAYKLHTVELDAQSRLYVLWSVVVKSIAGKKPRWYAAWYSSDTGSLITHKELLMESLAGSAQHSVVKEFGPNGLMRTYDTKLGHRVVDPNDLTVLPLPKFSDSPRFISAEELRWEKPVSGDLPAMVIVSEVGAILRRATGRPHTVFTIRKQDGVYVETGSAKSTTPSPIKELVWANHPYLIQPLAGHFVIVDTSSGSILGACEGRSFLGAQVTDSVIRVALAASMPAEVRIFEVLKPKAP